MAVRVKNWDGAHFILERLLASNSFEPDKKLEHRLIHQGGIITDIIPFGELEDLKGIMKWSRTNEVFMSTIGFEEAFQNSMTIQIKKNPKLDLLLCTPPGLTVLKLIAWNEKYPERNKDAKDLLFLLRQHINAGNDSRLYDTDKDLLKMENFDYELASGQLLGRDIGIIVNIDNCSAYHASQT